MKQFSWQLWRSQKACNINFWWNSGQKSNRLLAILLYPVPGSVLTCWIGFCHCFYFIFFASLEHSPESDGVSKFSAFNKQQILFKISIQLLLYSLLNRPAEAKISKIFFFARQIFLFKSFAQTKWAKKNFEKLPKKGHTVVYCAFLRSKTKILRNLCKISNFDSS